MDGGWLKERKQIERYIEGWVIGGGWEDCGWRINFVQSCLFVLPIRVRILIQCSRYDMPVLFDFVANQGKDPEAV